MVKKKKKRKKKPKILTRRKLLAFGVPAVLIPGIMLMSALNFKPADLFKNESYYQNQLVFPKEAKVLVVIDGDTVEIENGLSVRLLGINSPNRGEDGFEEAKSKLESLVKRKKLWLEYDRYQDDKYGRILAWVWVGCESEPELLPAKYMHLSKNKSCEGLIDNPKGCLKGKLVNEEMVKSGWVEVKFYKDRGALKYQGRLVLLTDI